MPKVTVVQVIYNSRPFIEPVFSAIFAQTFKDFEVVAVIAGNNDNSKELLAEKFPRVKIIDPGYNIGFAAGHNLVFSAKGGGSSEFYQLVNPDFIMEPDYLEKILQAFNDEKVGAATGKLYQADKNLIAGSFSNLKSYIQNHKFLDTTGVNISKSGRARDRGQHEADVGQYDKLPAVDAVSGAGCMYRASALQATSYKISIRQAQDRQAKIEFFDEDFHSYWEDVDLSWRMANAGWKNVYVPQALGYHGRAAGSSRGGYWHVIDFIKHHRQLNPRVRQLNYQNHIFMYIKNSKWFYPQFFAREFFMFWYILLFEPNTLKILPQMLKLLPKMFAKRKFIETNINRGRDLY